MRLVGMATLVVGSAMSLVGCGSEPAPHQPTNVIVGDGTFRVGTDIESGTYRTAGDRSGSCQWSRISGLDGVDTFDNRPGGPQTVVILAGDDAFETEHCQDWQKVIRP